ncbi:MAG: immunoglobulin domain-containing protein, partial [Bacteroidota bacterium]
MKNRAGVTLGSRTRSLVVGINKVYLGFAVPKDFDYQLGVASANGLKTFNGTSYPYTTNGLVSIKTSSLGTSKYLGLFDWIVRVDGLGCFVTTDTVNVVVNPRPITSLTNNGTAITSFQLCEGNRLLLKASTGTGYTYEWTKNGVSIPFATADTFAVKEGGIFGVKITIGSTGCSASSSTAETVNVGFNKLPEITVPPKGVNIPQGFPLTLSATVSGATSYQWYRNNVAIAGATQATYNTVLVADTTLHSGNYYVKATNLCGDVQSFPVPVTVYPAKTTSGFVNLTPKTVNICPKDNVSMIADVKDTTGVTYQWYKGNTKLTGVTGRTYTIMNIDSAQHAGNYWVIATGPCEIDTSKFYTITVFCPDPAILSGPNDVTICENQNFSLSLATKYVDSYQWYKYTNTLISGATDSIYQRIKAVPSESGKYFVVLKNQWNTTVSKNVNVVVDPVAVITQHPRDTTILKLNSVTFSVSAVGAASYQWRYNGNIIPGATNISYTIPVVYFSHAGNYSCDVFSTTGCLTSSKPARLNVQLGPPPKITTQTDSVTICEGTPLDIIVAIKPPPDTQPVRVTWFKNNALLRSDLPSAYTVNNAGDYEYQYYKASASIADIGTYHVLFEALDSSTAVSKSVPVQVNPNPVAITTPTGKQIICEGDSVVLSSSTGAKYQWLRLDTTFQDQVILNAVNRKYTVKKSGIYAVLVDNEFGCQTHSAPDTVVVRTLPDPTFTPSTFIACVNDTITLTANDPSLTAYQWFLNGKAISGATQNIYYATVTGDYFLQVTNDAGCKNADSTRQITSLLFNVLPTVDWIT